jgi:hypothetical protein
MSDYEKLLEEQNEQLQKMLAKSQLEVSECKNIINNGRLIVIAVDNHDNKHTIAMNAEMLFNQYYDTDLNKMMYRCVKSRYTKSGDVYTIDEVRQLVKLYGGIDE